jgi:hypothetical protein
VPVERMVKSLTAPELVPLVDLDELGADAA